MIISQLIRADAIVLVVDGDELAFEINEFRTRKQAIAEANAYRRGFAECARIIGNRSLAMLDVASKLRIE